MDKWKVYKVLGPWIQGGCIYKVGRPKDESKPLEDNNIEWQGFTSTSWAEAMRFAAKQNKEDENESGL